MALDFLIQRFFLHTGYVKANVSINLFFAISSVKLDNPKRLVNIGGNLFKRTFKIILNLITSC
jgi:hypothetical protein